MAESILTYEIVQEAIEMARPSVEAILSRKNTIWGPKSVFVAVSGPMIHDTTFRLGSFPEKWNPKWGEVMDFEAIALSKCEVSRRTGMPTSVVISQFLWLLKGGDFLYPGGFAENPDGLAVGVSGAKGETDEMIASLIYGIIKGLCILKAREMRDGNINRL